jgi:hypothetical protein
VFKSKVMDTDEKFSYTFTKAGTYPYYCSIHPKMTGNGRREVKVGLYIERQRKCLFLTAARVAAITLRSLLNEYDRRLDTIRNHGSGNR